MRSVLPRWMRVSASVLPLLLLGTACSDLGLGAAQPLDDVVLTAADDVGEEPFMDSVADEAPDEVQDVAEALEDAAGDAAQQEEILDAAAEEGLPVIEPASPIGVGLWGGSGVNACDVKALKRFMEAESTMAAEFARVQGIDVDDIPDYVDGLTAGFLLADADVVNHRFADGEAVGFDAVLEAGTAVLADADGVPRVRCACGNPLQPPAANDDEDEAGAGDADGDDAEPPAPVDTVEPAEPVDKDEEEPSESETNDESEETVDGAPPAEDEPPVEEEPPAEGQQPPEPPVEIEVEGDTILSTDFADAVVDYRTSDEIRENYPDQANAEKALGIPDYCNDEGEDCYLNSVSLGTADSACQYYLDVEFIDNTLVNGPGHDLRVVEIGYTEPTDVFVLDGDEFVSVGSIAGGDRTIDLSPAFEESDRGFTVVRLCDVPDVDLSAWPGADIDAIGAVNAGPAPTSTD